MAADSPRLTRVRRGLELVKFRAVDDSGAVDITYFNQSYIKDQIVKGESYVFYGKIEFNGGRRAMPGNWVDCIKNGETRFSSKELNSSLLMAELSEASSTISLS